MNVVERALRRLLDRHRGEFDELIYEEMDADGQLADEAFHRSVVDLGRETDEV